MSLPVWKELPPGVAVLKDYNAGYSLVECSHAERVGPSPVEGEVFASRRCPTCGGTSDRPEKRLAVVRVGKPGQLTIA